MKIPLLISCLLLPACSLGPAPRSAADWRALQRERLQQLYSYDRQTPPPSPVQYVRPSAHWTPARAEPEPPLRPVRQDPQGKAPQEPIGRRPGERAIDDVEPAVQGRRDGGFRDAMGFRDHPDAVASPRYRMSLEYGRGSFAAHSSGTQLDDRTSAQFFGFHAEPYEPRGVGPGVSLQAFASDNDLFHGETIYNGAGQQPADAIAYGIDMFPHWRWRPQLDGRFQLPMRLGAYVDWLRIDHRAADVNRNWFSVGPRVEVQPEYWLWRRGEDGAAVFGRLGGDLGFAHLQENWVTGSDSQPTSRWSGEVGGGVRLQWRGMFGELSYRFQRIGLGDAGTALYAGLHRVDLREQGLFLEFGGRF